MSNKWPSFFLDEKGTLRVLLPNGKQFSIENAFAGLESLFGCEQCASDKDPKGPKPCEADRPNWSDL